MKELWFKQINSSSWSRDNKLFGSADGIKVWAHYLSLLTFGLPPMKLRLSGQNKEKGVGLKAEHIRL